MVLVIVGTSLRDTLVMRWCPPDHSNHVVQRNKEWRLNRNRKKVSVLVGIVTGIVESIHSSKERRIRTDFHRILNIKTPTKACLKKAPLCLELPLCRNRRILPTRDTKLLGHLAIQAGLIRTILPVSVVCCIILRPAVSLRNNMAAAAMWEADR